MRRCGLGAGRALPVVRLIVGGCLKRAPPVAARNRNFTSIVVAVVKIVVEVEIVEGRLPEKPLSGPKPDGTRVRVAEKQSRTTIIRRFGVFLSPRALEYGRYFVGSGTGNPQRGVCGQTTLDVVGRHTDVATRRSNGRA